MIMKNFLKGRKSVRDFRNKKVSLDILDNIKLVFKDLESEYGSDDIQFRLYEYGENIYNELKGIAGYEGVMIESPHYIALDIKNREDKTVLYSGYYMEKLVTKLNELGLDTCWVSVYNVEDKIRKAIFGESTGNIDFILAFGYSKRKNPFIQESFSERLSLEEIIYDKEIGKSIDIDYLEEIGLGDIFFYLRFAPSIKNKQPCRFIVTDDKIDLLIRYEDGQNPPLIDAGIAMYYFETLAFLQGIKNRWTLLDGFIHEGNINYKYIAEYTL